jgi:hypothetical protein
MDERPKLGQFAAHDNAAFPTNVLEKCGKKAVGITILHFSLWLVF